MRRVRIHYLSLVLLAALATCTSKPTAPEKNPTEPESGYSVAISGPSSPRAERPSLYTASMNLSPSVSVTYRWQFDDSMAQGSSTREQISQQSWTFHELGRHIIRVTILRSSDSMTVCSALDTIVISPPVLIIKPSQQKIINFVPCTFTASVLPDSLVTPYSIRWQFDTEKALRQDVDTISHMFSSVGRHVVYATYTVGSVRVFDSAVVQVGFIPSSLSDYHKMMVEIHSTFNYFTGVFGGCWGADPDGVVRIRDTFAIQNNSIAGPVGHTVGQISKDFLSLETIEYSLSLGSNLTDPGYAEKHFSSRELPLKFFTSDSLRFGFAGPEVASRSTYSHNCTTTWGGHQHSSSSGMTATWKDTTNSAVIVTFYK